MTQLTQLNQAQFGQQNIQLLNLQKFKNSQGLQNGQQLPNQTNGQMFIGNQQNMQLL